MLKKLLPVVFLIVGLGAGGAAGYFLRPAPEAEPAGTAAAPAHGAAADAGAHGAAPAKAADGHGAATSGGGGHGGGDQGDAGGHEFVKLNNQFIVPVLANGKVSSLVILSLSLEVKAGARDEVFAMEPKLRDAFLRVMFDHANAGGFTGNFTSGNNMLVLRDALKEVAYKILGPELIDVLIIDMVRQDA